jgi:hypothetical protein
MSEKWEYFDETWSEWRYYRGGKHEVFHFLIAPSIGKLCGVKVQKKAVAEPGTT